MVQFANAHEQYKLLKEGERIRLKTQKYKMKQKEVNPESFRLNHNKERQESRRKQKDANPESLKLNEKAAFKTKRDK
jgi:hypothetical protein